MGGPHNPDATDETFRWRAPRWPEGGTWREASQVATASGTTRHADGGASSMSCARTSYLPNSTAVATTRKITALLRMCRALKR